MKQQIKPVMRKTHPIEVAKRKKIKKNTGPLGQPQAYQPLHRKRLRRRGERQRENLFKEMTEHFPKLVKKTDIQIQGTQPQTR